jgi:hypothetical protein
MKYYVVFKEISDLIDGSYSYSEEDKKLTKEILEDNLDTLYELSEDVGKEPNFTKLEGVLKEFKEERATITDIILIFSEEISSYNEEKRSKEYSNKLKEILDKFPDTKGLSSINGINLIIERTPHLCADLFLRSEENEAIIEEFFSKVASQKSAIGVLFEMDSLWHRYSDLIKEKNNILAEDAIEYSKEDMVLMASKDLNEILAKSGVELAAEGETLSPLPLSEMDSGLRHRGNKR